MPRALALRYVTVPDAARDAYLARLAERVASAKAAAFHLWAFEGAGAPGRVVEFVEARDAAALDDALAADRASETAGAGVPLGAPLGRTLDLAPHWERFVGLADAS